MPVGPLRLPWADVGTGTPPGVLEAAAARMWGLTRRTRMQEPTPAIYSHSPDDEILPAEDAAERPCAAGRAVSLANAVTLLGPDIVGYPLIEHLRTQTPTIPAIILEQAPPSTQPAKHASADTSVVAGQHHGPLAKAQSPEGLLLSWSQACFFVAVRQSSPA